MSTTAISIQSEESAWAYIEEALRGKYDSDVVELSFDNWPIFRLNVKGERYDSTVTTSLMRSFVDLQNHLNRIYTDTIYGRADRRLTTEEYERLEILFKVEQGSSNFVADLSGFFSELGRSAMEKMSGRQVVIMVLGVAAIFSACSAFKHYSDNEKSSREEKYKHEITMALLDQQPSMWDIERRNEIVYSNILKSVKDANKATLDKHEFTQKQLSEIDRKQYQNTEVVRIDGSYFIRSMISGTDHLDLEVVDLRDGRVISAKLSKEILSSDDVLLVSYGFINESTVSLKIVARLRGDMVLEANIIGVDHIAAGVKIAEGEEVNSSILDDYDLDQLDLSIKKIYGPDNEQG